jgi:hypothetical protein
VQSVPTIKRRDPSEPHRALRYNDLRGTQSPAGPYRDIPILPARPFRPKTVALRSRYAAPYFALPFGRDLQKCWCHSPVTPYSRSGGDLIANPADHLPVRMVMLRMARRYESANRKTKRRWHLAPVITHGSETLEGGRVLDEVENALGVLLWQLVRDVRLWATTPVQERGALFTSGAGARLHEMMARLGPQPELLRPLQVLVAMVTDAVGTTEAEVALACDHVAEWAMEQEKLATALDFAQAAALVVPDHAASALKVARNARLQEEHARAETWLRRTITVARQAGDWAPYSSALLELGRLYQDRQNSRAARRFFIRALRAATRRGYAETRATVLRELRRLA